MRPQQAVPSGACLPSTWCPCEPSVQITQAGEGTRRPHQGETLCWALGGLHSHTDRGSSQLSPHQLSHVTLKKPLTSLGRSFFHVTCDPTHRAHQVVLRTGGAAGPRGAQIQEPLPRLGRVLPYPMSQMRGLRHREVK